MALRIVRHDITKIEADAIVNSTNEQLTAGGLGVDASIHYAAGPELKEALDEIGFCPTGSSVVTKSFHIATCKYIIHAVAPCYQTGDFREKILLRKTYHSILRQASEKRCKSVAIPLLSAGANGYPKKEAYEIAASSIRSWLSAHYASELDIILVLYDKDVVDLSESIDQGLRNYITDYDTIVHKEALREYYEDPKYRREPVLETTRRGVLPNVCGSCPAPSSVTYPIEKYSDLDLTFPEMCEWWCKKKGIKKGEFFSSSNITRATFSSLKTHPERAPKKNTAFACAVGLRLDFDQAQDLLQRAGMTFSKHYPTDRLVEQCIRNRKYDIDEINLVLYETKLPVLGYSKKD